MSKYTALDDELYGYILEHTREDDLLRRLREQTERETDMPQMQISPDQGAFLEIMARSIGARTALEVGTFTGYSAICIARALPDDGALVTCDVSEEWTAMARRYWEEAGVAERIELRLGPAADTLRELAGPFDFAFIDADKVNYSTYWEEALRLVRPGGLILVDNVFAGGSIASERESGFSGESLDALRRINDTIVADERVQQAMVSVSDGITVALKR